MLLQKKKKFYFVSFQMLHAYKKNVEAIELELIQRKSISSFFSVFFVFYLISVAHSQWTFDMVSHTFRHWHHGWLKSQETCYLNNEKTFSWFGLQFEGTFEFYSNCLFFPPIFFFFIFTNESNVCAYCEYRLWMLKDVDLFYLIFNHTNLLKCW